MKDQSDHYDRKYYENVFFKSAPNSQRNQQGLNELLTYKREGICLKLAVAKVNF
jgi:hypothetical protein